MAIWKTEFKKIAKIERSSPWYLIARFCYWMVSETSTFQEILETNNPISVYKIPVVLSDEFKHF